MNYRQVIADAWTFTKENRRLMWLYAFVPSILTTLFWVGYMLYQFFAFKRSPLFDNAEQGFLKEVIIAIFDFLGDHGGLWLPAIIVAVIFFILYALLPTLLQGGLIQVIARRKKQERVRDSDGISLGFLIFLPLLEYHLLIKSFSIISIFTEAAFVVRNLGTGALTTLLPFFLLALGVGLILTLLFTYADFFIVLDKKPVLRSMGRSAKLVILSWQHTFLITILMLIIGVRVIFNILAVLLVPALMFLSFGIFAATTFTVVGLIIGLLISLGGLFVAGYFTGVLHVFATAVWTFTFLELMNEKHTQEFMN